MTTAKSTATSGETKSATKPTTKPTGTKPKTTTPKTTRPKTTTGSRSTKKSAAETAASAAMAATATRTAATGATAPKAPAAPAASGKSELVVSGPMMRKKELIDTVVEVSGIKKKDAKPVVEAMLKVMGTALREGRDLNLHPFGSLKVRRAKDMTNARILTTKVRQRKVDASGESDETAATPTADAAE